MEKSFIFQTIFGLIFVSNGISSEFTTSDFVSLVGTYSEACQSSFSLKSYTANTQFQASVYCSSSYSTTLHMLTVLFGFCTNVEFKNFTETACKKTSIELIDSETKILFYQAISNVSYACQLQASLCFRNSAISVILKQQEQYCSLMAINLARIKTEVCLISGEESACSAEEVTVLKEGACISNETSVDQGFSNALLNTSVKCRNTLSGCMENDFSNVIFGKYCDLMTKHFETFTLKSCAGDGDQCTTSELNMLHVSACGEPDVTSGTTTLTSVTTTSQETVVEQTSVVTSNVTADSNMSTIETSTNSVERTSTANFQSVEQTTVMTSSVSVDTSARETSTQSVERTSPVNSPKTTTSKVKCIPRRKNRKFVDKRKVVK